MKETEGNNNDGNGWTPIGTDDSNSFLGIYDGGGYQIIGLKVNNAYVEYSGLFGYLSGTVKNVVILNGNINVASSFSKSVGSIAGYGTTTSLVSNCSVISTSYTGGVAGQ